MNVHIPALRTKAEFLRWTERQERRYEFVRGRVVMMVNNSNLHVQIVANLAFELMTRLDRATHLVATNDFAVHVGETVRFPDVVVDRQPRGHRGYGAVEPVLLAEVLSPSSSATDFGPKVREYTSLPSVLVYLVLSQDEPRAWVWRRGEDGAFAEDPEMIEGAGETIALPALGLALPLAELYRGVTEGGVTEGGPQP